MPDTKPDTKPLFIAIDISGSTYGYEDYYSYVKDELKSWENTHPNAHCILWNNRTPRMMSIQQAIKINCRIGENGTDPSTFVKYLPSDEAGINLVIITDGQIDKQEVDRCAAILDDRNIRIKELIMHIKVLTL
ncbi:hypothetical protein [Candidatus Rickettsiella viridis]|uniref:hypothetical protein n=1 Tax=Candidatus Rickettsiella viridis TaxID=676208 RepID=UPI000F829F21|nr:hypothetical protein [Candidatus Rickettsiella viridis]